LHYTVREALSSSCRWLGSVDRPAERFRVHQPDRLLARAQFVAFGNNFTVQRVFHALNNAFWYADDYAAVQQLFQYRQRLAEAVVVVTAGAE
jgi:hypothetical protein